MSRFTVCRSYISHCVSKCVMSFCLLNDYIWINARGCVQMQEHLVMGGGPRSPGPYKGFFSRPASSDLGVIAGCPGLRTRTSFLGLGCIYGWIGGYWSHKCTVANRRCTSSVASRPLCRVRPTSLCTGPTWPDLSNLHTAMTADLMMDIMSSNSDREVSSCGFCAVKIIVSIQYSWMDTMNDFH